MTGLVIKASTVSIHRCRPTNQCTRIAKQRLIETGWACGVTLASKVVLLARNRVISSVRTLLVHTAPIK
jgi:hypothetical protein